jgi:hypothetical protein
VAIGRLIARGAGHAIRPIVIALLAVGALIDGGGRLIERGLDAVVRLFRRSEPAPGAAQPLRVDRETMPERESVGPDAPAWDRDPEPFTITVEPEPLPEEIPEPLSDSVSNSEREPLPARAYGYREESRLSLAEPFVPPRRSRPWFTGPYVAFVAVLAILSAIAVRLSPGPPEFTRYTSPPMSDGTRITFLYPAKWQPTGYASRPGTGVNVAFMHTPGTAHSIVRWIGFPLSVPEGSVTLFEQKRGPGVLIGRHDALNRTEAYYSHIVQIAVAGSDSVWLLDHRCSHYAKADFSKTDQKIVTSFEVLLPGQSPRPVGPSADVEIDPGDD